MTRPGGEPEGPPGRGARARGAQGAEAPGADHGSRQHGAPEGDPLALPPEEMRRLAELTAEMLVEMVADLPSEPALRRASPEEMEERVPGEAPTRPRPYEEVLSQLRSDVLPYTSHIDHPRYFAFIPTSGTFPGALGDFIASALNVYVGSWMEGAGLSRLELVVLDWFKDWIGYPAQAGGILVSGGSAANMGALACAREALVGPMRDDVVAYASDQSHSSVARAARTLGFRPHQLRVLPTDERFRMRVDALEGAIAADRAAGLTPLFVGASAGSTNTGAIDPLGELARVCREHGAWLHVDGAYGGFAALSERGRRWLDGIGLADSVTLDPHKWLYQPYECGCLLVREGRLLRQAFEITPDYLKDAETAMREVNFADLGLQLSRTSRALKVWMSVNTFGLDAFRHAVDRALDLARLAQKLIEESEELELLLPAQLGVVCFRRRFGGDRSEREVEELNNRLVTALDRSGEALVSSTRLRGRYAIRLCVLNHASQEADVRRTLEWLERADVPEAPEPLAEAGRPSPADPEQDPHGTVGETSLEGPRIDPGSLRVLPVFESLSERQLETVADRGRITTAGPGEAVISRWERDRDFYVVVEGAAEVRLGDEHVRDVGVGDFFGELAALDWGAGYGYARLATVVATEPARLLALDTDAFNALVNGAPGFAGRVREAAAERLDRT